ncbi:hypothetical protein PUMCH_001515 [Australozyma saopauloensis]|uniref:Uncharacterized protein n=1 Tax=Australozyma saopauloensis TaxID=291208 RepID=A0AAX4H6T8_9ASCO|nr:hypothetical protein PUMCH_001515 [[Candida] saopauloensis]
MSNQANQILLELEKRYILPVIAFMLSRFMIGQRAAEAYRPIVQVIAGRIGNWFVQSIWKPNFIKDMEALLRHLGHTNLKDKHLAMPAVHQREACSIIKARIQKPGRKVVDADAMFLVLQFKTELGQIFIRSLHFSLLHKENDSFVRMILAGCAILQDMPLVQEEGELSKDFQARKECDEIFRALITPVGVAFLIAAGPDE